MILEAIWNRSQKAKVVKKKGIFSQLMTKKSKTGGSVFDTESPIVSKYKYEIKIESDNRIKKPESTEHIRLVRIGRKIKNCMLVTKDEGQHFEYNILNRGEVEIDEQMWMCKFFCIDQTALHSSPTPNRECEKPGKESILFSVHGEGWHQLP